MERARPERVLKQFSFGGAIGGGLRRCAGWEAEALQNFPGGVGRMNRRENPHAATAPLALQNVRFEHAAHEFRPHIIA